MAKAGQHSELPIEL